MVLSPNQTNNRMNNSIRKRFFLILLIFNSFLGCIYYYHEKKEQQQVIQNVMSTKTWKNIFIRQKYDQYSIQTNKALEFIRKTLENEYNQDDLIQFYNLVQTEYSLGLKCTRTQNTSPMMVISNCTNQTKSSIQISNAIVSSSYPTLITSTPHSSARRFQRTDLYTFTIDNSDACLNEPVDLVIIVMSKSVNYKIRDAIRRTWASGRNLGNYSSINIKYFFLTDCDEKLSNNIRLENNLFHDIIQVELPQQYTLVTHRVLSLFEWSFRYCRTAKFLFKTDDDIFINLILLLKFISPLIEQPMNNSFLISDMNIYGYRHPYGRVIRHANDTVGNRYVITTDEYPCSKYPAFLSGFGYLISKKARDAIVYTAYQDPEPFRISDVYFTGIIPNYLSISPQSISGYHIRYEGDCESFFRYSTAFACAASFHHGDTSDAFNTFNRYWQLTKRQH